MRTFSSAYLGFLREMRANSKGRRECRSGRRKGEGMGNTHLKRRGSVDCTWKYGRLLGSSERSLRFMIINTKGDSA